ncbi:hypothetical protein [Cupriavidus sp. RAF12]
MKGFMAAWIALAILLGALPDTAAAVAGRPGEGRLLFPYGE